MTNKKDAMDSLYSQLWDAYEIKRGEHKDIDGLVDIAIKTTQRFKIINMLFVFVLFLQSAFAAVSLVMDGFEATLPSFLFSIALMFLFFSHVKNTKVQIATNSTILFISAHMKSISKNKSNALHEMSEKYTSQLEASKALQEENSRLKARILVLEAER